MEVISGINIEYASTKEIQNIVNYFAEKFGIGDDIPEVRVMAEINDRRWRGAHYGGNNKIKIAMDEFSSIAELAGTVAHETWHARQSHRESEVYEYNRTHYVTPELNYALYRSQIKEKKAWEIGEQVSDIIRRAYLKTHPKEAAWLAKEFARDDFYPSNGFDVEYFRMAAEMRKKPQPHRGFRPKTSFFGGFLGFRNKKKDDYE